MLWNICHTLSALFGSVLLSNVCNSFCVVTFKRWVTLKKLCCFNNLKVFKNLKSICHNFNTLFNRSPSVFCDVMVLIWRHVVQCSMCVTWLLKQQNYGIKRKKEKVRASTSGSANLKVLNCSQWDFETSPLASVACVAEGFIKRACKWTPKSSGEVARKIEPEVFHFFSAVL